MEKDREQDKEQYTQKKNLNKNTKEKQSTGKKNNFSAAFTRVMFLLCVFIISQVLFYYSDFFKIREVKVYGNHKVSSGEIIETAQIVPGENFLSMPTAVFRQRLEAIHWIKQADFSWNIKGTYNIRVEERKPVLIARQEGRVLDWFSVSEDGMTLNKASAAEMNRYPKLVIEGKVSVGHFIAPEPVRSVNVLVSHIPADIRKSISYYLVDEYGEITIQSIRRGESFKIKIGRAENLPHKMEILKAIIDLLDRKNKRASYIDIRFRQPVTKLVDSSYAKKVKAPKSNNTDKESENVE